MRAKVTFIRNNNGHNKYDKYQFYTQRRPKNFIITKNLGKVQWTGVVLYKKLYLTFSNIHRKSPVLESLFNKVS